MKYNKKKITAMYIEKITVMYINVNQLCQRESLITMHSHTLFIRHKLTILEQCKG